MKKSLVIVTFIYFQTALGQTDFCIDKRYLEAIRYINQTPAVRSFVKEKLNKKALRYKVENQLIKSRAKGFYKEVQLLNISQAELHEMDSLSATQTSVNGLNLLSIDSNSVFKLEFSSIVKNKLYAHITAHEAFRAFNNGAIAFGGGSFVVFLFCFKDDGQVERVFYHTLTTER